MLPPGKAATLGRREICFGGFLPGGISFRPKLLPGMTAVEDRVGLDSVFGLSYTVRLVSGIRKAPPLDGLPPQGRCSGQRIDWTGGVVFPCDGLDLLPDNPVQMPLAVEVADQFLAQGPEKQAVARREFLAEHLHPKVVFRSAVHRRRPAGGRAGAEQCCQEEREEDSPPCHTGYFVNRSQPARTSSMRAGVPFSTRLMAATTGIIRSPLLVSSGSSGDTCAPAATARM